MVHDGFGGDGRRRARTELALAEAAAARGARALEAVADALGAPGGIGPDEAEALAARVRATVGIERLVEGRIAASVELGGLLARLGTMALIALPGLNAVATSLAMRHVGAAAARAVLAAFVELAHVADAIAPDGGVELLVVSEVEGDGIMVAVAVRGACAAPVAAGAGARAFARARRLAALFGGEAVEGWRDGAMLLGLEMELGRDAA